MVSRNATHCNAGHDLKVVGVYSYTPKNGREFWQCKECKNARLRAMRAKARVSRQPRHVELIEDGIRANRMMDLVDRKWRASTWWERDEIQRQIDEMAGGGR